MREFLQRAAYFITGAAIMFVAAVWTAVLTIQGVLGLSAMPDDYSGTKSNLESFFQWLLQQDSSLVSFMTAGILFLLGLFVITHAWARQSPASYRSDRQLASGHLAGETGPPTIARPAPQLASDDPPRFIPDGLYVGPTYVSAGNLDADLFLTISMQGFNATGAAIAISAVRGAIHAYATGADGKREDLGPLLPPRIMSERSSTEKIENFRELQIVLEQRISPSLAKRLSDMSGHNRVGLRFADLEIVAHPVQRPADAFRVRTWAGVDLSRSPTEIIADKVAETKVIGSTRFDP